MSPTSECTATSSLPPPKSSFKTTSPGHSPIPNLSQTDNLRGHQSSNRVPSGGNRIPGGEPTQRSHMVSGGAQVRHSHYSIHINPKGESIRSGGSPAPRQVSRVDQVGRKHVSTQLAQVQPSQLLKGVIPHQNRLSGLFGRSEGTSDIKTKENTSRFWRKKTKAVHNPCHSRAPLAPCLSFPVMMLSSISRLSSVESIKILPKFHRPTFLQNMGAPTKETKESINLSASSSSSSRSPKIHKVVHKYRTQCHKDDKEFLRAFLRDDGDDLDGEDDEDEDQSPNPLKATLKFFKRIPRALDLPHPTRSSSFGSSGSSSSNDSSQQSYSQSAASLITSSVASSNHYSWNRAQRATRNRTERECRLESLEL
ncbi:hypothetical protein PGTUg99_004525 [Puccinia graminis f. sp. tritici]|uniref:Uncharacterized protein n=1 Tax=Puccinia graminis f. sp. tritici TaxID=56615 RepID=A0A5B0NR55_PUCGR|nr:hypothetical protein PGTUg99_004525 [Puccinia graminis f. sp. tritici]